MNAADYGVTFGYDAQDGYWYGPNGRLGLRHLGNDRPTPRGTPIVIGGHTIGRTGATGTVSGAHLHTQAGTDIGTQNTFNPTPLEFQPGTVVRTRGTDTGQWGKYITLMVGGRYITYAHLDSVDVNVGDEISGQVKGESNMQKFTKSQINQLSQIGFNRPANQDEKDYWATLGASDVLNRVLESELNRSMRTKANNFDKFSNALNLAYGEIERLKRGGDTQAQEVLDKIKALLGSSNN